MPQRIAILGAVISAHFGTSLDRELGAAPLSRQAANTVSKAKEKPLAVPETERLPPGDNAPDLNVTFPSVATRGMHENSCKARATSSCILRILKASAGY